MKLNKKAKLALGLVATTAAISTTTAYADTVIYGEEIPAGHESEYTYLDSEKVIEAYKDLKKDDALSLKEELEKSGYTKVTLNSYLAKTGEVSDSIELPFETEEEADKFVKELKDKGVIVENVKFTNDTKVVEGQINKTDLTKENAEQELETFKSEYNNKEDFTGKITPVKTKTIISEENGTTSYETAEDAQKELDRFLASEDATSDSFYFEGTVVGPKGNGTYEEHKYCQNFKSKKEADDFISRLEKMGYTIVSYKFTNDTKDDSITGTYDTEEEAQQIRDAFLNEFNLNKSSNITKNYVKTNSNAVHETFTSEEDLNKYLSGLNNMKDTVVTVETTRVENTTATTVPFTGTYDSMEEAKSELAKFKGNDEVAEGEISKVRNTDKDTQSTTTEDTVYATEAAANARVNELTMEDDTKKVTATKAPKVTTEKLEDLVKRSFEKESDAIAYLAELRSKGYTIVDYSVEEETVEYAPAIPEINTGSDTSRITNNNRANLYIRLDGNVQFENGSTHYNVNDYVYAGQVAVKSGKVYDLNADKHKNDLAYLVNVNNSIADEITASVSQAELENQLKKYGITLNDDQVIVWYVLKNASDDPGYKTYKDKNGNDVSVYINKCYYHIDGIIMNKSDVQNITELYYKLHGTATKVSGYTVTSTTTTKGYDYNVRSSKVVDMPNGTYTYSVDGKTDTSIYNYTLNASGTKELESGKADIEKKRENQGYFIDYTKKAITYSVEANGTKTVELESGILTADTTEDVIEELYSIDLEKDRYEFVGGIGNGEINPETGDNGLWIFTIGGFSMIGLAGTSYALRKTKKEEK